MIQLWKKRIKWKWLVLLGKAFEVGKRFINKKLLFPCRDGALKLFGASKTRCSLARTVATKFLIRLCWGLDISKFVKISTDSQCFIFQLTDQGGMLLAQQCRWFCKIVLEFFEFAYVDNSIGNKANTLFFDEEVVTKFHFHVVLNQSKTKQMHGLAGSLYEEHESCWYVYYCLFSK